jgi:hypothetical protein
MDEARRNSLCGGVLTRGSNMQKYLFKTAPGRG